MTIEELIIKIRMDSSPALSGLSNFQTALGKTKSGITKLFSGDFKGAMGEFGQGFDAIGTKGIAAAAGITVAVVAVAALALGAHKAINELEQVGGDLANLGRQTGLSGDALTGLYGQFRMTGTDAAAAGTSIGRFSKNLQDARAGGKSLDVFKSLGVDVRDANGNLRDGNDVLADTRNALSALHDPYVRNADALALFGRGYKDLARWMTASKGDIASYNKIIAESGFSWGPKQKKDYATFVKDQRELSLRWQLMWASIGQKLIPILNTVLHKYIMPMFARFTKFITVLQGIPGFTGAVRSAFQMMFGPIFQAVDAIGKIVDAIDAIQNGAPAARSGVVNAIGSLYSTIPGFDLLKGVLPQSWVPSMASGGYVPARQGGTLVRLGEGGKGETVTPDGSGRPRVYNDLRGAIFIGSSRETVQRLLDLQNGPAGRRQSRLTRGLVAPA